MGDSDNLDIHKSHKPEQLDWDEDELKRIQDLIPGAKYGAVSESLRHSVSEKQVCKIGCHGTDCKYCNPMGPKAPWKEDQLVIKGLFSNWVTENILAMSRPSTKAVKEYDIIEQFKDHGIRAIINLQQPGEHVSCGFGNEPDGFSYNSKDFMDNDIFFYNFGWPDYGIGSMANILDMVKVMQYAVSQGKVAVHCHAGLGRTGVLIAAYLIYTNRTSAHHTIHYIRSKRKGAIQTSSQIQCIQEFERFLQPLRVVFAAKSLRQDSEDDEETSEKDFSLRQFLSRQQSILHGQEARRLKYIPKPVYVCCQRLLEIADRGHRHEFHDRYQDIRAQARKAFLNENLNGDISESDSKSEEDKDSLKASLRLPLHASPPKNLKKRESYTALTLTKRNRSLLQQSSVYSNGLDSDALGTPRRTADAANSVQHVVSSMAESEYTEQQNEKIAEYKESLNTENDAYDKLYKEEDASVVAALMWHWLDALREPILHAQDLPTMLMNDTVETGLQSVSKFSRGTLEVLFYTIARLLPIEDGSVHDALYCRALSTLAHQNMVVDIDYLTASTNSIGSSALLSRTSNSTGIMRGHLADRLMHFFVALTRNYEQRLHHSATKRKQAMLASKEVSPRQQVVTSSQEDVASFEPEAEEAEEGELDGDLIDDLAKVSAVPKEISQSSSNDTLQSSPTASSSHNIAKEKNKDCCRDSP